MINERAANERFLLSAATQREEHFAMEEEKSIMKESVSSHRCGFGSARSGERKDERRSEAPPRNFLHSDTATTRAEVGEDFQSVFREITVHDAFIDAEN